MTEPTTYACPDCGHSDQQHHIPGSSKCCYGWCPCDRPRASVRKHGEQRPQLVVPGFVDGPLAPHGGARPGSRRVPGGDRMKHARMLHPTELGCFDQHRDPFTLAMHECDEPIVGPLACPVCSPRTYALMWSKHVKSPASVVAR